MPLQKHFKNFVTILTSKGIFVPIYIAKKLPNLPKINFYKRVSSLCPLSNCFPLLSKILSKICLIVDQVIFAVSGRLQKMCTSMCCAKNVDATKFSLFWSVLSHQVFYQSISQHQEHLCSLFSKSGQVWFLLLTFACFRIDMGRGEKCHSIFGSCFGV